MLAGNCGEFRNQREEVLDKIVSFIARTDSLSHMRYSCIDPASHWALFFA